MNKVYLVEMDNGESYEDYHAWIEKAFTSYRNATKWLIDEGYEVFPEHKMSGKLELNFYWQESDEYMADCSFAKIIEMVISK